MVQIMNRALVFIFGFVAAGVIATAIFMFWLIFLAHIGKPEQAAELPHDARPTPVPETPLIPTVKIKLADVNALGISTVFTGFYDANSDCGKSIAPAAKPNDVASSYSLCRTVLEFKRSGEATKMLVVKRPDKNVNSPDAEEKTEWQGRITDEQFEALAKAVAGNDDFIEWANVLITHSNCSMTADHKNGTTQLPLFVQSMNPRIDAFKQLDKKVAWQKN